MKWKIVYVTDKPSFLYLSRDGLSSRSTTAKWFLCAEVAAIASINAMQLSKLKIVQIRIVSDDYKLGDF